MNRCTSERKRPLEPTKFGAFAVLSRHRSLTSRTRRVIVCSMPRRPVGTRLVGAAVSVLQTSGIGRLAQDSLTKATEAAGARIARELPSGPDVLVTLATRLIAVVKEELPKALQSGAKESVEKIRARALRSAASLILNEERMRGLLSVVVSANDDPELGEHLAEHVRTLRALTATIAGKPKDDPDVVVLMATLWGIGFQNLIVPMEPAEAEAVQKRLQAWIRHMPDAHKGPKKRFSSTSRRKS